MNDERQYMEWCLTETGNGVSYFGALCWFIQGGSFTGMLRFWKLLAVNNHI